MVILVVNEGAHLMALDWIHSLIHDLRLGPFMVWHTVELDALKRGREDELAHTTRNHIHCV